MAYIEHHGHLTWVNDPNDQESTEEPDAFIAPTFSIPTEDVSPDSLGEQAEALPAGSIDFGLIVPSIQSKKGKLVSIEPPVDAKAICIHCGKTIRKNAKRTRYGYDAQFTEKNELKAICANCLKHFVTCKACACFFKPDELKYNHCPTCIERAPENIIRNYSFKVEDNFDMRHGVTSIDTQTEQNRKFGVDKPIGFPKDEIFYGVELELASSNLGLDVLIVDSLIRKGKVAFATLKKDSSIKPKGYEIVSVPATLEEHRNLWNEFFEKLPPTSHPFRSCGMHVHASRSRMSDLQIAKMLVFLHAKENRPFVELIAGRTSNPQNDFTKPKTFLDVRKVVDRHTALNLNNEHTIEFRIFASTRDKRIFLKNLEFVRAIIKFADWSANSIKSATNWRKFVDWVMQRRKDYEYLCLFFETESFRKLMDENNSRIS
jgi:hypothetical protein